MQDVLKQFSLLGQFLACLILDLTLPHSDVFAYATIDVMFTKVIVGTAKALHTSQLTSHIVGPVAKHMSHVFWSCEHKCNYAWGEEQLMFFDDGGYL